MPSLFAAVLATVPCHRQCRCRRCRRCWWWQTRPTDCCRPPPPPSLSCCRARFRCSTGFSICDHSCWRRRCHCRCRPAAMQCFSVAPFSVWGHSHWCRCCHRHCCLAAAQAITVAPISLWDCTCQCRRCCRQHQRQRQCHRLSDIFLLQDLNRAAGRCRGQLIIVATKPYLPLPPPILLSSLSCLKRLSFLAISGPPLLPPFLVCGRHHDCCIIAICSQCFLTSWNVATGNTVGNLATTKTGNTVTCHCTAASCQEAPPGAWEMGGYLTAGAEANHSHVYYRWTVHPSAHYQFPHT